MAEEVKPKAEQTASSTFFNTYIRDMVRKSDFKDFEDRLHKGIDEIVDEAKGSTIIRDAYGNSLASVGTDDRVKSFSTYGFDNSTLNWPLWLALYNDSWVFRRAIDKPAQDEVNCGITIHGSGETDYGPVYKAVGRYAPDLIQLISWGALFGGSVGVMMFDGIPDEDMKNPINKKKIRNRRMRLYVTDRWYGVQGSQELVTNMRDIDFGKPMYYNISFADGKMYKVHHSYVLRYEHRWAPKLIKTGQLQGWGYAEGSHILNELSRDDQLKASITSLVNKSLIEIIKMAGMRGVFMGADKGNEEQLTKRLEMVNWARTYNSLTFLDKDDEYEAHELSGIQGMSSLLETNMWLVAAAVEMQGVLFGDLKGGLSQESDAFHRYAVTIMNRCNSYYRPVMQKLLTVLYIVYGIDETPDFDFNPLDAESVNNTKVASIQAFGQMLNTLIDQGTISKYQAAVSLKEFINNGAINIEFNDLQLNRLRFEEYAEILAAYKTAGQAAPSEILAAQFPQEDNPFAGRVTPATGSEYREASEAVPEATAATEVSEEETANETVERE